VTDELPLGIPEKEKKTDNTTGLPATYSYTKYTATDRRFCNVCVQTTPKVNGVPVHAMNKASFMEKGPEGTMWLCFPHKEERRLKNVDLKTATKNAKKHNERVNKKSRGTPRKK
jgi:hypothetical protein